MHPHPRALLRLQVTGGQPAGPLDRPPQHILDRAPQGRYLVRGEVGRGLERRDPRRLEDVVGVGVADAADHGLVAQHALDLRPGSCEQAGQGLHGEGRIERVGSEPGHSGNLCRVAHHRDGQALARALLGEVEAAAPVEVHAQRERSPARLGRSRGELVAPPQPSGPGEVHHQVQPADVEVQELPAPSHSLHQQPREGAHRRIEGLQHVHRDDVDPHHGPPDGTFGEQVDDRLYLGKLRHHSSVPRRLWSQRPCLVAETVPQ